MSLAGRDRAVLWHPYTQMRTQPPLLEIKSAQGVYLYTEDGRRILDGIASWWVNVHGHSHPKLNDALARQARECEHVIFAGATHRPAVELAERLLAIAPPGLAKVFYSDNGSTAVEVAMKMAIQYWRNLGQPHRRTFITLEHAYHGDTVGAMSASAESVFTQAFSSMLFPVVRLPHTDDDRSTAGARLDAMLAKLGDACAGVLIEPMLQAAGGMILWPAQFLKEARAACDRHGTLLIADEVMTGFGRTGRMFACEHGAISPDLLCLSKGLTAGYLPLGATLATQAVYDAFLSDDRAQAFFHGHSYTANPLACAVALASLDLFRDEPVLERVAHLERLLRGGLSAMQHAGKTRVIGGVGVVELDGDPGYLSQIGPRLYQRFLDRNLLLRPLGNVLYFMPPFCITESEMLWSIEQIQSVLSASNG